MVWLGETVTRIRAGESIGTDRYGEPIPGSDVETDFENTLVADGRFAEPLEVGRSRVEADLTLYWPGREVDGVASDRWRVRGKVYEAVGDAFYWTNGSPNGPHGTVARLARTEG